MTAIKFGLNQRHHADTAHREVLHQSVDLDIYQYRRNEMGAEQGHFTRLRAVEPAVDQPCISQVLALACGDSCILPADRP